MRWLVLCAAAAVLAVPATASESSSLVLDTRINTGFGLASCPPGTPESVTCYAASSSASIRGLGSTTWPIKVAVDRSDPTQTCSSWTLQVVVGVAGKGGFTISGHSEGCPNFNESGGMGPFTVAGGNGRFAGASASGTLDLGSGRATTPLIVKGTLTVPGYDFDLTPPTISVRNKTVKVGPRVRAVRVRYRVTTLDEVDGPLNASCRPRSGSRFRVGRTRVECSAMDSSANGAGAKFTITVKRRR